MKITARNTALGWYIDEIVNDKWIRKNYYGYTKREAIKKFRQEFINKK